MSTPEFRQFVCLACGYIYDEALGDPDGGLAPGTRFEAIPDDWMCPTCGVGKADFEPYATPARQSQSRAPRATLASRGSPNPIVIVGAGPAGWAVAEAVRALDAQQPLLMISGCSGAVYSKPLLSVALAQGRDASAIATETGEAAARRLNLRLMHGTWVSGIDAPRRRLRTTRGTVPYARLVLALGATPAPLPLDDDSNRCLWRVNHLDHYIRFRSALGARPKHVAIVGAGLIGCEIADDLAGVGHRVTLVDTAARPLQGLVAPETAAALLGALGKSGVMFVGGTQLKSVRQAGDGLVLTLRDQVLQADIGLAAIGLRTDGRLAHGANLAFNNGYLVDPLTLRTSDPWIHALGDCASFDGKTYRFIEPIRRQARAAAAALLEQPCVRFDIRDVRVRLKSRSMPLTFSLAA